jgi:hypothetical protein
MAGLTCPNASLEFDLACTVRLSKFDAERDERLARLIAYEVSKMFGDGSEQDDDPDMTVV